MPKLDNITPKEKKPNYKVKYLFGFRGESHKPISAYRADLAAGAACGLHCGDCKGDLFHLQNRLGTHWLRHRDAHDPEGPDSGGVPCMASTWEVLEQALCGMLVEYMRNEPDADQYDIYDVHDPEDSDMAYYLKGLPNYRTDILTVNRETGALTFYEMVVTSKMSDEKRIWLKEKFDLPHEVWLLEMWRFHDLIHSYLKDDALNGETLTRIIDEEDLKKQVPTAYSIKEETARAENIRRDAEIAAAWEKIEREYEERQVEIAAEKSAKVVVAAGRMRSEGAARMAAKREEKEQTKDFWPEDAIHAGWEYTRNAENTTVWRRYRFENVPAFEQIPGYKCEIMLVMFVRARGFSLVWVNAESYLNNPSNGVKFSKTYRKLGKALSGAGSFARMCVDRIPLA